MEVQFANADLDRLETAPSFRMGFPPALVIAYRKRLQFIRAALDERDFRAWKGLHFERLEGKRQHQYSMRLNDQFRLIVEFVDTGSGKQVRIIGVEDYH